MNSLDDIGSLHVGVLALQGAFHEHSALLKSLKISVREVRLPSDFDGLDALILPGGESTAMSLIGERWGIFPALKQWVKSGRPIWGTCAGMILLCNKALLQKAGGQTLIGGLDAEICRNYFGSQVSSFETPISTELLNLSSNESCGFPVDGLYPAVFIRAPAILSMSEKEATVLAKVRAWPCVQAQMTIRDLLNEDTTGRTIKTSINETKNENLKKYIKDEYSEEAPEVIVAAQKENLLVTAFHPELVDDPRWHIYFLKMVKNFKSS